MKKLCVLMLLATVPLLRAMDKKEQQVLQRNLARAVILHRLSKIEYLLDAGADPRNQLHYALSDADSASVAVVKLLVRKGVDVERICDGRSPLEKALGASWQPFEQRKAKILALMDGGVRLAVDRNLQCHDEADELMLVIENKVEEGARWRVVLPKAIEEFLPVAALTFLVGQYAYPYYDYEDIRMYKERDKKEKYV